MPWWIVSMWVFNLGLSLNPIPQILQMWGFSCKWVPKNEREKTEVSFLGITALCYVKVDFFRKGHKIWKKSSSSNNKITTLKETPPSSILPQLPLTEGDPSRKKKRLICQNSHLAVFWIGQTTISFYDFVLMLLTFKKCQYNWLFKKSI